MKNLKKLSRNDLKQMIAGNRFQSSDTSIEPTDDMSESEGSAVEKTYRCCTTINHCDKCTSSSNCPSDKFLRGCF